MTQTIKDDDFRFIKNKLLEYVKIIFDKYGNYIDNAHKLNVIANLDNLLKWNDGKTISFLVRDSALYLPNQAYSVFEQLKKSERYGIRKRKYETSQYLKVDTTYNDYINEVIECGLTPTEYFLESLLHETMHLCGSTGSTPLEEGINELKTRELAQGRKIDIAAMAYPKEVEIALMFQKIIGQGLMSQLTFILPNEKYGFLESNKGVEYANLYTKVSQMMATKSRCSMLGTGNPYVKASQYDKINYNEEKDLIQLFIRNSENGPIERRIK